jgi:hypothetical protein
MLSMRRFQLLLLSGVVLLALYFSYQSSKELYAYLPLQAKAPARVLQWEIEDVKGKFALQAAYSFEAQGKIWENSFRLLKPYYWNEPAAISSMKRLAKEEWSAWYDPKNPDHSALEKSLPIGLLFRTMICYGVLIYFFYLQRRVALI